jgi:DNA-binding beta-propeller fold protein YncE
LGTRRIVAHHLSSGSGFSLESHDSVEALTRRWDHRDVASTVAPERSTRHAFRLVVVVASICAAIAGSVLLATRGSGEKATSQRVSATLQVPSHPGWLAAGPGALWLALNRDAGPVGEKPLLRLDLASGVVRRTVSVGGEASYITRVGDLLIASVRHAGESEFGGRRLFALSWRSGRIVAIRGFNGPVDHVAADDEYLWALETRPGTLLRLDPHTLEPTAPPLRLSADRTLDVTVGAGYVWVTAADTGELLRIDPVTRAIRRIDVGGFPQGVVVAGGSVWYADHDAGEVVRRDVDTLEQAGAIHVDRHPTWLAAAGRSVFVSHPDAGTVSRIDIDSGKRVGAAIRVAPAVDAGTFAMTAAGSSVWVSSFASNTVSRIVSVPLAGPSRTVLVSGSEPTAGPALPRGGRVVAALELPAGFNAFAVGEGAVWVMNNDSSTLMRIDPETNEIVARTTIVDTADDAAAGAGALWLSNPAIDTVSRVDPSTNEVTATIRAGPMPAGIDASRDAVWVANSGGPSVSRIDPRTNRIVATIRVGPPRACCSEHMSVFVRDDAVWVAVPNANEIVKIDPATNTVAARVQMPYSPCAFITADADTVWNSAGGCGDVIGRIDAHAGRVVSMLEGEPHPVGLVLAFGSVWVAALHAPSIDRLDPETERLTARLPIGGSPVALEAGFGSIWVADDGGRLLRIDPQG